MSTPGVSHPSPTAAEDFRRVLDERAVQPAFQPVVELDWACRAAAFTDAGLRVVVEVTERAVAGDPARLLATVTQAREAGWAWPWTTSAPRRPAWPCCRSSAAT